MSEKVTDYTKEDITSGDAIYYDPYVTPVLTYQDPTVLSQQKMMMFTDYDRLAQIYMFNMLEKVNRVTKLWNGKNLTVSYSFRNNTNHYAEKNYNIRSSCVNTLYLSFNTSLLVSYQGQQYKRDATPEYTSQFLYVDNLGV